MPYSALSLTELPSTRQLSTQRRKMPSPSKPFTVKPCTTEPCTRWVESVRQLLPAGVLEDDRPSAVLPDQADAVGRHDDGAGRRLGRARPARLVVRARRDH